MSKISPFLYVKSINKKDYQYDLSGYVPFLVNRAFAAFIDCIMLAEEMNQAHLLSPSLQYDFYYYAVRKGSRFNPIPKPEEPKYLEVVMEHYHYSKQKALEVINLLSEQDILAIIKSHDTGGKSGFNLIRTMSVNSSEQFRNSKRALVLNTCGMNTRN